MRVLQKRSKEERREREKKRKESHAATRSSAIITVIFFIYGTGLCLLEWCGAAVRNFQAKEIERALVATLYPNCQMRLCDF